MRGDDSFLKRHTVWTVVLTIFGVLVVAVVLASVGGDSPTKPAEPAAAAATTPSTTAKSVSPKAHSASSEAGTAAAALATLPVKGRAPKTGYSRDQFGDGWATVAGCDQRDRVLGRDLSHKSYRGGSGCVIERGRLNDPYTATAITFVRGGASEVDIDHVVALSDAWQKGAQQWSPQRRAAFANDPLNLLSVDAPTNRRKGDGDAATWLPPNKRFRCAYVARQVAVKQKYGAWVTKAEHDAIVRVLATCPQQQVPRSGRIRVPVVPTHRAPAPATAPSTPTTPAASPSSSQPGRAYANCDAVRAAGLAPLREGSAGYAANTRLDRDGDGVACE